MKTKLLKLFVFALLFRLLLSVIEEHADIVNYYWWAKDIFENGVSGFYERSIDNAMPPTYPPVTSYIFWFVGLAHKIIWEVLWFVNLRVGAFPSMLIHWFESAEGWYFLIKIPSILFDLGIAGVLYKLVEKIKNERAAYWASFAFLISPPFWYNSAVWGQTDSIFAFFLILGFYLLSARRRGLSFLAILVSLLTKPTAMFVVPIYILWFLRKTSVTELIKLSALTFVVVFVAYYPFHRIDTIQWIVQFYTKSLGGELDYLVANTFNLWALLFGFDNRPENFVLFGVAAKSVGYALAFLFSVFLVVITYINRKKVEVNYYIFASVVFSFLLFLILPRMHERYFYPTLLMFVPLVAVFRRYRIYFWGLSTIHLINLYHFWWFPKIPLLVNFLSNSLVEKIFIIANIVFFVILLRQFYEYAYRETK